MGAYTSALIMISINNEVTVAKIQILIGSHTWTDIRNTGCRGGEREREREREFEQTIHVQCK